MAARLCGFGETLVISDETRARLDDAFLVEDLGPQTFKNVAEPVRVHLVKEELAPAAGDAARPEAAREVEQPGAGTESSGEDEQRPGRFTIRGVVTEAETGRALPALLIRAYDKDLVFDDHLGDARSDAAGRFEIHFTDEFFGGLLEENPDIYLRVFERTGSREIHSTMDRIRRSAGALEIFEVQIARAKLPAEDRTE
jgi:hypothetical protein